jgi:hypothetical protein
MKCIWYTLAAASFVSGAHAHHSTALVYDRGGALIEAEGVITEVAWVNPHVRFKMRGAGADGVERLWDIESNSVSIVSRFGLTAEVVAAGTRVKVAGNGGRQADNVLWLTNMLLPSGEELGRDAAAHGERRGRTRGVQSADRRSDDELRGQRHAVHHGAAVSDRARQRG